ncbi:MAG: DUF488 family protein [Gammaproteobacteria bacterium]
MSIRIKRVYDDPGDDDGLRVLVDRLWPRGLRKADARIDLWAKDLAPSAPLRKWFGHEAARFDEFRSRYLEELEARPGIARELREQAAGGTITLLFAARDRSCNHAVVLRDFILKN